MDRSKFSARIAVVLLLFWATGGQWLVLQSIAWSGMIIDYSKTDHLCGAVSKTFDGDHPCRLCLFIQKQKVGDEDKPKNPIAKAVKAELFGVVFAQLPVLSFLFLGTGNRTPFRLRLE